MARKRREDHKQQALREQGILHPHPDAVTDPLFSGDGFFDARDLLQVKYEMVRSVRVDGRSILEAAENFGLSRPTYYQAQEAFLRDGLPGLLPAARGPQRAHKLSVDVMAFVDQALRADPSLHVVELVRKIQVRFKLEVHPRSLERALARSKKG